MQETTFIRQCRNLFRFLEQEWGFSPESPEIYPTGEHQGYVNPDLKIRILFSYDFRERYVDVYFLRYPDGRLFGGFEQPEWLPSQEFARFLEFYPDPPALLSQLREEYAPVSEWERLGLIASRKKRNPFAGYSVAEEVLIRFHLGFYAFVFQKLGEELIVRVQSHFGLLR